LATGTPLYPRLTIHMPLIMLTPVSSAILNLVRCMAMAKVRSSFSRRCTTFFLPLLFCAAILGG
jgi:hypothetical protein